MRQHLRRIQGAVYSIAKVSETFRHTRSRVDICFQTLELYPVHTHLIWNYILCIRTF